LHALGVEFSMKKIRGIDLSTTLGPFGKLYTESSAIESFGFAIVGMSKPMFCRTLREKSLASISSISHFRTKLTQKMESFHRTIDLKPILQLCNGCHSGAVLEAPTIPFGDPIALGRILGKNRTLSKTIIERIHSTGDGKMPPNQDLKQEEIDTLEDYVKTVRSNP
jgi:hypothetical protein